MYKCILSVGLWVCVCVQQSFCSFRQTPFSYTVIVHLMISDVVLLSGSLVNMRDDLHWTHTDGKSAFQTHPDCKHSCVIQCSVCVCVSRCCSLQAVTYITARVVSTRLCWTSEMDWCLHLVLSPVITFSWLHTHQTHTDFTTDLSHDLSHVDISRTKVLFAGLFVCISAFQIRSSFWLTGE